MKWEWVGRIPWYGWILVVVAVVVVARLKLRILGRMMGKATTERREDED